LESARAAFQGSLLAGANSYLPVARESGGFLMPLPPPPRQIEQSALPPSGAATSQPLPSPES